LTLDNYKQTLNPSIYFIFCQHFRVLYARKCLGILQVYICLAVLNEIVCLQFYICILLSVLLFYVFVCLPHSVPYDVLLLKTLRVHAPETPCAYSLHWPWL